MTPLQLATTECSNHQSDGSCVGAQIGERGAITICIPQPRCLLAEGNPCTYFEECLLAGIPAISNPRKADEWEEAENLYKENIHESE